MLQAWFLENIMYNRKSSTVIKINSMIHIFFNSKYIRKGNENEEYDRPEIRTGL